MFLGTQNPRLDEKNRLVLPAKYIADLAEGIVLTRGQEHCLYIYARNEFDIMYERLRLAPITSREARNYQRILLAGAHDEIPDRQRRVTIPQHLREYAGLTRDLTLIGVGDRLEVWDEAAWDEHFTKTEISFAHLNDEVIPGLL